MFAERLKQAMEYRGKTITDVSTNCGLSKGLLSNYLNGKFTAKQKNIYIIAKYLDVSPSFLLGITDKMILSRNEVEQIKANNPHSNTSHHILEEINAICSYQDEETLQTILTIIKSLDKRKEGDTKFKK